jgi:hypothetical protein
MDPQTLKQASDLAGKLMKNGAVSSDAVAKMLQSSSDATASASGGFSGGAIFMQLLSSLFMPSFTLTSVVFLTLLSFLVARRAMNKGRNFWIWFLYTYTAAYLAIVHVCFLSEDENGELHREGLCKCPFCGMHVSPEAKSCPICRRSLETEILAVPRAPSEMKPIAIIVVSVLFIIISKFFELRLGSLL